jgi:tripartite-type tricarboxylate transporter receptor subunit TctC
MTGFIAMVRIAAMGVLMLIAGQAEAQQAYPNKPLHLIAPYAPGGGTDIISRLVAQKLTESLGQPVIVDNRPGGNTMIGTEVLAKSPPDGYTIELVASTHVLVPLFFNAPYDPVKDFTAIATLARSEFVLLMDPAVPATNLKELIAYAKSKPGQLNYATPAAGGTNHLVHEMLNLLADVKMQHIPYNGSGPAITALLAGQVQLHFSTTGPTIAHINSGRLKALGVTGETRLAALPQVPTFIEAGLPGVAKLGSFYGIVASAGTTKPIVDRISSEIAKHLAQPDFREKLIGQGLVPYLSTPEQFAALLKERLALNAEIIKKANIKLEN